MLTFFTSEKHTLTIYFFLKQGRAWINEFHYFIRLAPFVGTVQENTKFIEVAYSEGIDTKSYSTMAKPDSGTEGALVEFVGAYTTKP